MHKHLESFYQDIYMELSNQCLLNADSYHILRLTSPHLIFDPLKKIVHPVSKQEVTFLSVIFTREFVDYAFSLEQGHKVVETIFGFWLVHQDHVTDMKMICNVIIPAFELCPESLASVFGNQSKFADWLMNLTDEPMAMLRDAMGSNLTSFHHFFNNVSLIEYLLTFKQVQKFIAQLQIVWHNTIDVAGRTESLSCVFAVNEILQDKLINDQSFMEWVCDQNIDWNAVISYGVCAGKSVAAIFVSHRFFMRDVVYNESRFDGFKQLPIQWNNQVVDVDFPIISPMWELVSREDFLKDLIENKNFRSWFFSLDLNCNEVCEFGKYQGKTLAWVFLTCQEFIRLLDKDEAVWGWLQRQNINWNAKITVGQKCGLSIAWLLLNISRSCPKISSAFILEHILMRNDVDLNARPLHDQGEGKTLAWMLFDIIPNIATNKQRRKWLCKQHIEWYPVPQGDEEQSMESAFFTKEHVALFCSNLSFMRWVMGQQININAIMNRNSLYTLARNLFINEEFIGLLCNDESLRQWLMKQNVDWNIVSTDSRFGRFSVAGFFLEHEGVRKLITKDIAFQRWFVREDIDWAIQSLSRAISVASQLFADNALCELFYTNEEFQSVLLTFDVNWQSRRLDHVSKSLGEFFYEDDRFKALLLKDVRVQAWFFNQHFSLDGNYGGKLKWLSYVLEIVCNINKYSCGNVLENIKKSSFIKKRSKLMNSPITQGAVVDNLVVVPIKMRQESSSLWVAGKENIYIFVPPLKHKDLFERTKSHVAKEIDSLLDGNVPELYQLECPLSMDDIMLPVYTQHVSSHSADATLTITNERYYDLESFKDLVNNVGFGAQGKLKTILPGKDHFYYKDFRFDVSLAMRISCFRKHVSDVSDGFLLRQFAKQCLVPVLDKMNAVELDNNPRPKKRARV